MRKRLLWILFIIPLILSIVTMEVNAQEIHDIAIIRVTPSTTRVKLGDFVNITVVIKNEGNFAETFNVTLYYDSSIIGNKTNISLTAGANKSLTFSWNTTDVAEEVYAAPDKHKTYTLNATATIALDEDPNDNTLTSTVMVVSKYIAVVPDTIVDPTLTVGENFTVSIYTDYSGSDVWGWQFAITYNPLIIHGGPYNFTNTWIGDGENTSFYTTKTPIVPDSEEVYVDGILMTRDVDYYVVPEWAAPLHSCMISFQTAPDSGAEIKVEYLWMGISQGELIHPDKSTRARFESGGFDNVEGILSLTAAYFYYSPPDIPPTTTSGPGILANVTFTVVGTGDSNITLGMSPLLGQTQLKHFDYDIIDAVMNPNQIGHGYFRNLEETPIHDVAVISVTPSTTRVKLGDFVNITVVVKNEGNVPETFAVEVKYLRVGAEKETAKNINETIVRDLAPKAQETPNFSWEITDLRTGNYTIIAIASSPNDMNTVNNEQESTEVVTVESKITPFPIEVILVVAAILAGITILAIYNARRRKKRKLE